MTVAAQCDSSGQRTVRIGAPVAEGRRGVRFSNFRRDNNGTITTYTPDTFYVFNSGVWNPTNIGKTGLQDGTITILFSDYPEAAYIMASVAIPVYAGGSFVLFDMEYV